MDNRLTTTGLQVEHLLYAESTLASIHTEMYDSALIEGLPHTWTMHTIVPIHQKGNHSNQGTSIPLGLATVFKLCDAVLEAEPTLVLRTKRYQPPVRKDLGTLTTNHIL